MIANIIYRKINMYVQFLVQLVIQMVNVQQNAQENMAFKIHNVFY